MGDLPLWAKGTALQRYGWVEAVRCARQHLKLSKDQTDHNVPHQDGAGLVRFGNERKNTGYRNS